MTQGPAWFDYTPEAVAEWLQWLEDHPAGEVEGFSDDDEDPDPDAEDPDAAAEPPAAPRPLLPVLPRWQGYDSAAVFLAPYEDVPLLVPGLDIGRGRPTGLWGAPGAGKNDTIQALALAVMSGTPVFGRFPVGHRPHGGRVVHLTYDMGLRATALRYRRLANGMGLAPGDVSERLLLCAHPVTTLTSPNALKAFSELLQGYDMAILDNARGATPGVDENDSQFGALIALFGAAAEAAACVPIYLHHTRKGREDGKGGDGIDLARGSSAITAASGCVWIVSGQGAEPRVMRQVRLHDSSDGPKADFQLHRVVREGGAFDVGDHPSWRLDARVAEGGKGREVHDRIMRAVSKGALTRSALRAKCGGDSLQWNRMVEVITELAAEGAVTESDGKVALA